jgi:hypothetical protein
LLNSVVAAAPVTQDGFRPAGGAAAPGYSRVHPKGRYVNDSRFFQDRNRLPAGTAGGQTVANKAAAIIKYFILTNLRVTTHTICSGN